MPQTEIRVYRTAQGVVLLHEWLENLEQRKRKIYEKCMARLQLLGNYGFELRRPVADLLRDGIYELRIRHGTSNYRMLYFFNGRNAVVVSHGIMKEDIVPDAEIDFAIECRRQVIADIDRFTAELEF